MSAGSFRHIDTSKPRIMVVDGSKLARKMIEQLLRAELPEMEFIGCESGEQAKQALLVGQVNLVTTALALPDMDGLDLARYIREYTPQAYIPIIVVSGNVQERLESRDLSTDVTDYFDKSLGFGALAKGGKLVVAGLIGGEMPLSVPVLGLKGVSIAGNYVGSLAEAKEMLALVRAGKVAPIPVKTRPLAEANAALDDLRNGRTIGRTVLTA